jgi:uncharacterized membrane protein
MREDEKIQIVILSILAVYGVLIASPIVLGDRIVEPFSELGILGTDMKLGDYPSSVTLGEEFELFIYLGNHMGKLSYFRVYAKLGDGRMNVSDSEPYDGIILDEFDYVVFDNTNTTFPISLSINEVGFNKRLVFELHRYENDRFVYDGLWIQLWLNVTNTG